MTLRAALLAASLIAAVGGAMAVAIGYHAWPVAIWGSIIFVSLLIEHVRYRNNAGSHMADSGEEVATGERFVDPDSGVTMDVLYNPHTGERHYRAEADGRRRMGIEPTARDETGHWF